MGLSGALRSARSVRPRLGAPNRKKRIRSRRRSAHVRQFVPCGGVPFAAARALARSFDSSAFSGAEGAVSALQMARLITIFPGQEAALEAAGIRRIPSPLSRRTIRLQYGGNRLYPPSPARRDSIGPLFFQTAGSHDPSASSGVAPFVLAQAEGSSPRGSGPAFKAMRFPSADT